MPSRIVKSTLQACALSGLSNFLAQLVRSYRSGAPFTLDIVDLLRFVTFSMIMCPPNVKWQGWLESQFPAYTDDLALSEKEKFGYTASGSGTYPPDSDRIDRRGEAKITGGRSASSTERPLARRLNIRNTACKFVLDQSIGAAVNTTLFIVGIALLRGHDWASALSDVQTKFWPTTFAGQKLWPAVSIVSFTMLKKPEQRMLFGSVAGLFWGIYLSLVAGAKRP